LFVQDSQALRCAKPVIAMAIAGFTRLVLEILDKNLPKLVQRLPAGSAGDCGGAGFSLFWQVATGRIRSQKVSVSISDKALLKTKAYIDGKWVDSDSGENYEVTNPATGEVIAEVARCGAAETRRAIE